MAMESPVLLRYALIKGWTRGNRHGNDDTSKEEAMRKKVKRALCLIPILLIAALAITYAAIRHNARSPQELIKSKWGIELPQSCVQVYSAIGDIGIDGRGPKYRVFECGDSEDMKKLLQWRSISVKTYDNANVYPVLHGLETDEREIDGEYLIPLGEYMCFRQTKGESGIVLLYSEEQGRLYVFETVI